MKKGCVGCLLPALPVILLCIAVLFPLMLSLRNSVKSSSDASNSPSAPPPRAICGASNVKIPEQAVAWMEEAEKTSGIPAAWFAAITDRESDFRPHLFANDENGGTWGLFQINREEWASVYPDATTQQTGTPPGITDPMIHAHYGGPYFRNRLETVKKLKANNPDAAFAQLSDLDALVVAHNSGEGNLKKYPNLPRITREYLAEIQAAYTPQTCTTTPPASPGPGNNGLFGVDDYAPFRNGREGVDDWAFYWGECVSYVAFAIRTYTPHKDFHNTWRGGDWDDVANHFGNANAWDERARTVGIRVDTTPAVGAVAQHSRNDYGHVAFITAVHDDGTFDINEYNHGREKHHKFGTRTNVSIGKDFDAILHFEE